LIYDEPAFFVRYFQRLESDFADLMPGDTLRERLIRAMAALSCSDGQQTNDRFFMRHLADGLTVSQDDLWQRFLRFYANAYAELKPSDGRAPEGMRAVLAFLAEARVPLVLATNPVFPEIALLRRLTWIGLDAKPFTTLTAMERMNFIKPRAGYYRQIARMLGLSPERCLMVGNDPVNDGAAARTGMRVYLTTDAAPVDYGNLDGGKKASKRFPPPVPNASGPLRDLPDFIQLFCD